eukprot:jgi/Phyca11/509974/fgenesh2_kg.PHYCAscaffold_52_\
MKILRSLTFLLIGTVAQAENSSKLLRGPDPNYDVAGLFPGPADTVVDTPRTKEFEPEVVDEPVIPSTLLNELDENSVERLVTEVTTYDDYTSEYNRHLRSVNDPAFQGQIQLAEPRHPKEHMIPPSPHDDQVPNLRGWT